MIGSYVVVRTHNWFAPIDSKLLVIENDPDTIGWSDPDSMTIQLEGVELFPEEFERC